MTGHPGPAETATVRLHKKLYGSKAIALAVEAVTGAGSMEVQWKHAGSGSHHEMVVSGRGARRAADELAQTALEQTIVLRRYR